MRSIEGASFVRPILTALALLLADACSLETQPYPLEPVGGSTGTTPSTASSTDTEVLCDLASCVCEDAEQCMYNDCEGSVSCGLFACNEDNTACRDACENDSDCVASAHCEAGGKTCLPKTRIGLPCATDAECIGGSCRDGVCCDDDCAGDCRRCDLPRQLGACSNVPAGQQIDECVNAGQACDGAGSCKVANGFSCAADEECASGFCPEELFAEDVCCDKACTGTCLSCSGTKTGGVNGTCGFVQINTDIDSECPGTCNASTGSGCCNGSGACLP